jgi:anaphase-promoting complex subunit 2
VSIDSLEAPTEFFNSSERPDTIRCIVASLVVDGESGDSIVDDDEPIQPLQSTQVDDYTDPNWEPEPIDAGPGKVSHHFSRPSKLIRTDRLPIE